MIIGHENIIPRLESIMKSSGGTFLFYGPPSVGKRTVAFEVSKRLLCFNKTKLTDSSCMCSSCVVFDISNHPDFLCIGRIEQVRIADANNFLNFVSKVPFLSDRKCIVLDNAHKITWEAANRLLKVLEEPPNNMFFFLVSSEPESLIPTIRSRCCELEFGRLFPDDIANILWKKVGFDLPKARILGWIASGYAGIDIFSKAGQILKCRDIALEFVSSIKTKDLLSCIDFIDHINCQELPIFIDMLILILTDMLLIYNKLETILSVDLKETLSNLCTKFNYKAIMISVGILSQIKKGEHLNLNLNLALKNVVIKVYPLLSVV